MGDSDFDGSYDLGDADDISYGDSGNDFMGYKLHMTDLNGDGYEDILVGAPYNDDNTSNGGVVYGLMGSASPSWDGNDIQNDADFAIYGNSSNLNLGEDEIPVLGDNNGDGRKDLVLASEANGEAWVFFGVGTYSGDYDAVIPMPSPRRRFRHRHVGHADSTVMETMKSWWRAKRCRRTNQGAIYRYDYDAT